MLSEVRIVDRMVSKNDGTCASTAVIPKKNLGLTLAFGIESNLKARP